VTSLIVNGLAKIAKEFGSTLVSHRVYFEVSTLQIAQAAQHWLSGDFLSRSESSPVKADHATL